MSTVQEAETAIIAYLTSRHVPPTQQWLQSVLPTLKLNTPIVGLQKTALFRVLATDLTTSVQTNSQSCFSPNISDPATRQVQIKGPLVVQILDIEDIGHSRWSQVEAIEMDERGETIKGREVIRAVPGDEDNPDTNLPTSRADHSSGPHKLLVQDAGGQKAFAIELGRFPDLSVYTPIGAKLILRDITAARGLLLLSSSNAEMLGGKVEIWDKQWRDERKQMLKMKAGWTTDLT